VPLGLVVVLVPLESVPMLEPDPVVLSVPVVPPVPELPVLLPGIDNVAPVLPEAPGVMPEVPLLELSLGAP
jgi:hypothetical protein